MEKLVNSLEESTLTTLIKAKLILENSSLKSLCDEIFNFDEKATDTKVKAKLSLIKASSKKEIDNIIEQVSKESFTSSLNTIHPSEKKKVTIYLDGVFDIIHSGHFNAIRQAKKLGDILCIGVNSDEDVARAKGPTLMNCKERAALAKACKWTDYVVEDTPYTPSVKLLDDLKIEYCAHGDDIPYNEKGECVYDEIIKAGRMKLFKRTEGVSTTEIIGRLLLCTKEYKSEETKNEEKKMITSKEIVDEMSKLTEFSKRKKPVMSSFLATSWRIAEFSNNRVPKEGDKIVYIDGAFDILHIGHVETLRKAKELGDFLYVGCHDDDTVHKFRGKNYPILNLNERVFNLLALRYVDEVIIGAPWKITEDMIKSLKINVVVQGTSLKYDKDLLKVTKPEDDPYEIPKKLGIYQTIESEYDLTNEVLVERIIKNRDIYIKKYMKKAEKDQEFFDSNNAKEVKEI